MCIEYPAYDLDIRDIVSCGLFDDSSKMWHKNRNYKRKIRPSEGTDFIYCIGGSPNWNCITGLGILGC